MSRLPQTPSSASLQQAAHQGSSNSSEPQLSARSTLSMRIASAPGDGGGCTPPPAYMRSRAASTSVSAAGAVDLEQQHSAVPVPERVKVVVRVRPPLNTDENAGAVSIAPELNKITLFRPDAPIPQADFMFDKVLDSSANQHDVFNTAVKDVVDDVLKGYNGTVMAYGQTGAGKTYTLSNTQPSAIGMIPRAVAEIFKKAAEDTFHSYVVTMSYIQIYMELIQDLLRPDSENLQIREDANNGVYLANVHEVVVSSLEECLHFLEQGERNRVFAFTHLNAHSSRSHAVVMVTVIKSRKYLTNAEKAEARKAEKGDKDASVVAQKVKVGKLYMVDLAGSERLKKSKSIGLRASEAISINKSLTTLGMCISARANDSPHVPFRDSKLTRLLQESLGGNAKTTLVVCLADAGVHADETLQSLQFGSRAMCIKNKPVVNERVDFRLLHSELMGQLDTVADRAHELEAVLVRTEEERDQVAAELEREKARWAELMEVLRKEAEGEVEAVKAEVAARESRLGEVQQQVEATSQRVAQLEAEKAEMAAAHYVQVAQLSSKVQELLSAQAAMTAAHRQEVAALQEQIKAGTATIDRQNATLHAERVVSAALKEGLDQAHGVMAAVQLTLGGLEVSMQDAAQTALQAAAEAEATPAAVEAAALAAGGQLAAPATRSHQSAAGDSNQSGPHATPSQAVGGVTLLPSGDRAPVANIAGCGGSDLGGSGRGSGSAGGQGTGSGLALLSAWATGKAGGSVPVASAAGAAASSPSNSASAAAGAPDHVAGAAMAMSPTGSAGAVGHKLSMAELVAAAIGTQPEIAGGDGQDDDADVTSDETGTVDGYAADLQALAIQEHAFGVKQGSEGGHEQAAERRSHSQAGLVIVVPGAMAAARKQSSAAVADSMTGSQAHAVPAGEAHASHLSHVSSSNTLPTAMTPTHASSGSLSAAVTPCSTGALSPLPSPPLHGTPMYGGAPAGAGSGDVGRPGAIQAHLNPAYDLAASLTASAEKPQPVRGSGLDKAAVELSSNEGGGRLDMAASLGGDSAIQGLDDSGAARGLQEGAAGIRNRQVAATGSDAGTPLVGGTVSTLMAGGPGPGAGSGAGVSPEALLQHSAQRLTAAAAALAGALARCRGALGHQSDSLTAMQAHCMDQVAAIEVLRSELDSAQQLASRTQTALSATTADCTATAATLAAAQAEAAATAAALAECQGQLEAAQQRQLQLEGDGTALSAALQDSAAQVAALQQDLKSESQARQVAEHVSAARAEAMATRLAAGRRGWAALTIQQAYKRWRATTLKLRLQREQQSLKRLEQQRQELEEGTARRAALQGAAQGQALVLASMNVLQEAVEGITVAFVGRRKELVARDKLARRVMSAAPVQEAAAGSSAGAVLGLGRSQSAAVGPLATPAGVKKVLGMGMASGSFRLLAAAAPPTPQRARLDKASTSSVAGI